jgi:hypothetical protein
MIGSRCSCSCCLATHCTSLWVLSLLRLSLSEHATMLVLDAARRRAVRGHRARAAAVRGRTGKPCSTEPRAGQSRTGLRRGRLTGVVISFLLCGWFLPPPSLSLALAVRVLALAVLAVGGTLVVFSRYEIPSRAPGADDPTPAMGSGRSPSPAPMSIAATSSSSVLRRTVRCRERPGSCGSSLGGETVGATGGRVRLDGSALGEPYLDRGTANADCPETPVPVGTLFVLATIGRTRRTRASSVPCPSRASRSGW